MRKDIHICLISPNEAKIREYQLYAQQNEWKLVHSQGFSCINEDSLAGISLVIIGQTQLDSLSPVQANALERFVRAGGGLLSIHAQASGISEYKWPWLYHWINSAPIDRHSMSRKYGAGRLSWLKEFPADSLLWMEAVEEASGSPVFISDQQLVPPKAPADYQFEIQSLAGPFNEPQELEILPNGNVLIIERGGRILSVRAGSQQIEPIAKLPVWTSQSNGLTGMAIDPDFSNTGWVYFLFAGQEDSSHLEVARFQLAAGRFQKESKEVIMQIPIELHLGWHGENSLAFDQSGNLYISLADFTLQSSDIAGYAQIDERPGNRVHDAQRTSSNTQDFLGKILRIHPEEDGSYTIPEGNLFPRDASQGKPEIYVMGCRNPYRFSIDPKSNVLYFGDVGPDAWEDHDKGPKGYDEVNVVQQAGFFGWPYFVADNKPYRDYDYGMGTLGPSFEANHPINDSPNNTGIQDLPPAQAASLWFEKGPSDLFPYLNQGGMNIMVGPRYHADLFPDSPQKLPAYFSDKLFIYDWVRNWIRVIAFDHNQHILSVEPFLDNQQFNKIIDMELGPDGSLYLLEYGSLGYNNNPDAALKRITFAPDAPRPLAGQQAQTPPNKGLPKVPGYEKGRMLIEDNNCLSCHLAEGKLIGPGFRDIGMRYWNEDYIVGFLPKKIKEGGTGNWEGNIIMPAHPHLSDQEVNQMVAYILTLRFLSLDELKP
ncbi:MAG: PQQ-dependent sugar dehydrogenase [Bacteroidota bacterium]